MKENPLLPKWLLASGKNIGFVFTCLGLFVLYLNGCLRQPLEPLPFFEVYTRPLNAKLERLVLRGEVDALQGSMPESVGFMYNKSLDQIQGDAPVGQRIGARLLEGGNFEAEFDGLNAQETFFFRAYAQVGERTMYGNVVAYRLGDIVTMGFVQVSNDSALLQGSLLGLQTTGDTILEHGHVYSRTNTSPEVGLVGCFNTQLGIKSIDYSFQSTIGGLDFNTTYTVRSYAKGKTKIFYSAPSTFRVRDGWKKMPDVTGYQDALAAVGGNKAYLGFGCDAGTGCLVSSLPNDFWEFSPADTGGIWQKSTPFDAFFTRTNASTFTIGDTIYILMGEYFDTDVVGSEPFFVFDLLKFNIVDKTWTEGGIVEDIPKRSGAVAFALNGKGYIGAGEGSDGTRITSYQDFWEYTPLTGTWRPVASLPLRTPDADAVVFGKGRADAVAFNIGSSVAYVGSGRLDNLPLKDFWRFTPPTGPGDNGSWDFVGFFPGLARHSAIALSIGNKAYFGLGYNPTEAALADFWEFDPVGARWQARTAFPGGPRYEAVGFSIGAFGYAGTGLQKKVQTTGVSGFNAIYEDLWRYEPER